MDSKKSGIELIATERKEQIEKHDRSIEVDVSLNQHGQLSLAVVVLCSEYDVEGNIIGDDAVRINHFTKWRPMGWDRDLWLKMISKPYSERLVIAGALIAAEIDRLQNS